MITKNPPEGVTVSFLQPELRKIFKIMFITKKNGHTECLKLNKTCKECKYE